MQPLYCADFVFVSTLSVVLFCVDGHCIFLQTGQGKGVFFVVAVIVVALLLTCKSCVGYIFAWHWE